MIHYFETLVRANYRYGRMCCCGLSKHMIAKKQENKIKELNDKVAELEKMQWELMINTSTN